MIDIRRANKATIEQASEGAAVVGRGIGVHGHNVAALLPDKRDGGFMDGGGSGLASGGADPEGITPLISANPYVRTLTSREAV